jgi:hypothetical protein
VTLVNLVGRKGTYRMTILAGEAVPCGMEFPGNPLKVRFEAPVGELNRRIVEEGVGHHWMGGVGRVGRELDLFCKMAGIRTVRLA